MQEKWEKNVQRILGRYHEDLTLTELSRLMSSCPKSLNSFSMFWPVLALTIACIYAEMVSPNCSESRLLTSTRSRSSHLLPTRASTRVFGSICYFIRSYQSFASWRLCASVTSYTRTTPAADYIYCRVSDWNLSWPAVSHKLIFSLQLNSGYSIDLFPK